MTNLYSPCLRKTTMSARRQTNKGEESVGDVDIDTFAKSLLDHFKHVSVSRFHKLAFLAEYRYHFQTGNWITEAQYEVTLDCCFSKDLQEVVEKFDHVNSETATIGGDTLVVLLVTSRCEYDLSESITEHIEKVISEYGETPSGEIESEIESLTIYQNTKLGEGLKNVRPKSA